MDDAAWKLLGGAASSVITWALVLIGWLVVSERQVQMEISKNNFSKFSRLRENLVKIESAAIAYHTEGFDARAGRNIMRNLFTLGLEVSQLSRASLVGMSAGDYVFELKKAVTLLNFDPGEYVAYGADSELVQGIEEAADELDRFLLQSAEIAIRQPDYTILALLKSVWRRIF